MESLKRSLAIGMAVLIAMAFGLTGCGADPIPESDARHSRIELINTHTAIITEFPEECGYTVTDDSHYVLNADGEERAYLTSDMGDTWDGMKEDLQLPDSVRTLVEKDRLSSGQYYMLMDYNQGEMYTALIMACESTCLWIDCDDLAELQGILKLISVETYDTK